MPKKSRRSRCVHRPYSFAHLHPPLLHKRTSTCTKKNCKSCCLRARAPFTTLSDECAGMHTLLAATSTHTRLFRCCASEHARPSPYAPLPTWHCFAHPHQPHHLLLHERASTHTHADHCVRMHMRTHSLVHNPPSSRHMSTCTTHCSRRLGARPSLLRRFAHTHPIRLHGYDFPARQDQLLREASIRLLDYPVAQAPPRDTSSRPPACIPSCAPSLRPHRGVRDSPLHHSVARVCAHAAGHALCVNSLTPPRRPSQRPAPRAVSLTRAAIRTSVRAHICMQTIMSACIRVLACSSTHRGAVAPRALCSLPTHFLALHTESTRNSPANSIGTNNQRVGAVPAWAWVVAVILLATKMLEPRRRFKFR